MTHSLKQWVDEDFDGEHVWNPELIASINNDPESTWTAALPKPFEGLTIGQIRKSRLGAVVDPDHVYELTPKVCPSNDVAAALPTDFSSIDAWPYCASITGHIRDQSSCGSCWAFGSTEAFNDRLCISNVSSSTFLQLLSTEDTAACCSGASCGFSNGCNGGYGLCANLRILECVHSVSVQAADCGLGVV